MSQTTIRAADLDKLQLISVAANRIIELETFCWALLDWVEDLTQVEDCVVYVKIGDIVTQMAACGVKRDGKNELISRIGMSLGTGIVGTAAQEG